jgi:hypothetical protein
MIDAGLMSQQSMDAPMRPQANTVIQRIERLERQDPWLSQYYSELPCPLFGHKPALEDLEEAYRFGLRSRHQHDAPFQQVEEQLRETWDDMLGPVDLQWNDVQPIIEFAYCQGYVKSKRPSQRLKKTA